MMKSNENFSQILEVAKNVNSYLRWYKKLEEQISNVCSYLRKWEGGENTVLEQLSKNAYKRRRAL